MTASPKTILMLRHGKSDWQAAYGADHERPLAARGRRASRLVGRWVERTGLTPDLVLTSDAVRARTTAELAAAAGGWGSPIRLEPGFYGESPAALVGALRGLDEGVRTVLLAGHYPTWPETIARLTGGGRIRFPTAALAGLGYAGAWRDVGGRSCELLWLVTPKLLAAVME
ncbi:MAG: histidine phosphatase family protein [Acidobacteriota bacterium]|nr:histidine phosphatase family protein [Acidobacteriota bacterium]